MICLYKVLEEAKVIYSKKKEKLLPALCVVRLTWKRHVGTFWGEEMFYVFVRI